MLRTTLQAANGAFTVHGQSCIPTSVEPNRLLGALPFAEYQALARHFDVLQPAAQRVLAWPEQPLEYVYFERDGLASVLVPASCNRAVP